MSLLWIWYHEIGLLGCQLLSLYNDLLKVCTILNCNHVLGKNYGDILQSVQIRLIYETPLYFAFFCINQKSEVLREDGCTLVAEMFCAVIQCMILSFLYFTDYNTGGAGLCCCTVSLLYCTVLCLLWACCTVLAVSCAVLVGLCCCTVTLWAPGFLP